MIQAAQTPRRHGNGLLQKACSSYGRRLMLGVSLLAISACSIRPEPMTAEEHLARATSDRMAVEAGKVPFSGQMTLQKAVARAIVFNHDAELARLETTLSEKQLDLAITGLLPQLSASAGYNARTTPAAATSISELTGRQSLEPSYSSTADNATSEIRFAANTTEIGIAYFSARQQGYRALAAVERRRRAIDSIVRSTIDAYFKATAASEILPRLDQALSKAEAALAKSRSAGEKALYPPMQLLEFQGNLLRIVSDLRRMRTELLNARVQLAALINVDPSQITTMAAPPADFAASSLPAPREIEDAALLMRSELRGEAYQEKVERDEAWKEIIRMIPGIGMIAGGDYDSNRLLSHNLWGEIGIRATWNLMSLIQGPRALAVAKTSREVAHQRRIALAAAVISQVNLARQNLQLSVESLHSAEGMASVGRQMSKTAAGGLQSGILSDADRIRYDLSSMTAVYEKDKALAGCYSALSSLWSAAGIDIIPASSSQSDMESLQTVVDTSMNVYLAGGLPLPPTEAMRKQTPAAGSAE